MGIKTITTVGQPIYPRFATVSIGHIAFWMITRDPTPAPWKQTRGTEAESASGQWSLVLGLPGGRALFCQGHVPAGWPCDC